MEEEQPITWDNLHEYMEELRTMARSLLALEGNAQSFQPTSLLLSAFRRLVPGGTEGQTKVNWEEITWSNRKNFFADAHKAMRRALIDHARKRTKERYAPRPVQIEELHLEDLTRTADDHPEQIEALLIAIERLRLQRPEWAEVVEHRFFSGYTIEETARIMEVGERTVRRQWMQTRLFLHEEVIRILDEDRHTPREETHEVAVGGTTDEQWSRVLELVDQLRAFPAARREAELRARFDRREDSAVLSLVALQLRLPPEQEYYRVGQRIGDYTLEKRIGDGGMGVAYLAVHVVTGHSAVVKLVHPALVATDRNATKRFLEEIKTLGRMQHVGIARIYDGGVHTELSERGGSSFPYFAMEFVRGDPITAYARRHGLEISNLLELFLRVCETIHYAHSMGFIHCDLKPQHILVDEYSHPRVLDFGLAQLFDSAIPHEAQQLIAGTPAYMSPEQVTHQHGKIGPWTDVYALGLILYELLSGQRPYIVPAGPLGAIRRTILEAKPVKLGSLNSSYLGELENIVSKAIHKYPERRYRTIESLILDIKKYKLSINNSDIKPIDVFKKTEEERLATVPAVKRPLAWIADPDDDEAPLEVGRRYALNLQMGAPGRRTLVQGPTGDVPIADIPAGGLATEWVVSSDTVQLVPEGNAEVVYQGGDDGPVWMARLRLLIPRTEASAVRRLGVIPRHPSRARLSVLIDAVRESGPEIHREVYRRFTIELPLAAT